MKGTKTSTLVIATGVGLALIGMVVYVQDRNAKLALTIAAFDPSGVPYVKAGVPMQNVSIGLSDGSSYAYAFPVTALPSVSQLQGRTIGTAGPQLMALGAIPTTSNFFPT